MIHLLKSRFTSIIKFVILSFCGLSF